MEGPMTTQDARSSVVAPPPDPVARQAGDVARDLGVDPATGLSADEARSRLASHGPNRLAGGKKERIRTEVGPGSSPLFLVTEDADLDRLGERLRGRDSTLISTNLTEAERATLLETFGGG
jgi:hypothetical protein